MKAAKKNTQQNPPADSLNNDNIDTSAKNASKKLLSEIKTTDKGGIKDMINNPKQPHMKAAITYHALEKLRRGMRKKLKSLGGAEDDADFFDAQDSVELKDIPQSLIAQMGQELGVEDMDLSGFDEEGVVEDKDMTIENNLGDDFLLGSEQLLMNGFSLLAEGENESEISAPPLPTESAKPPEPSTPVESEAVFSSEDKPWAVPKPVNNTKIEEKLNLDSARNPDPPATGKSIPVITSNRTGGETPQINNLFDNPSVTPVLDEMPTDKVQGPKCDENEDARAKSSSTPKAKVESVGATPKSESSINDKGELEGKI